MKSHLSAKHIWGHLVRPPGQATCPPIHPPEVTATTCPLSRTAASTSANWRKSFALVPRISSLQARVRVIAVRWNNHRVQQALMFRLPSHRVKRAMRPSHTQRKEAEQSVLPAHLRCWRSSSVMPRMWRMKAVRPLASASM